MAECALYLSDVHSTTTFERIPKTDTAVSRFKLLFPSQNQKWLSDHHVKDKVTLMIAKDLEKTMTAKDLEEVMTDKDPEEVMTAKDLDEVMTAKDLEEVMNGKDLVEVPPDSLSLHKEKARSFVDEDGDMLVERRRFDSDLSGRNYILCHVDIHSGAASVTNPTKKITPHSIPLSQATFYNSNHMGHITSTIRNDNIQCEAQQNQLPLINENLIRQTLDMAKANLSIYTTNKFLPTSLTNDTGHDLSSCGTIASHDRCDGESRDNEPAFGQRMHLKRKFSLSSDDLGRVALKHVKTETEKEFKKEQTFDTYFINIKHSLATDLDSVGEQVWAGALLLCDYMLHHSEEFQGRRVIDLGAGTGLTSIVAAMYASHVYCTDVGARTLQLASDNVHLATSCPTLPADLCPVHVRQLDWFTGLASTGSADFSLTEEDLAQIKRAEILIAADVIYDNKLTDAFFAVVQEIMTEQPDKVLYIGLEKRLVFTIEDLDITSPGYNYFRASLKKMQQQPHQQQQPHHQQQQQPHHHNPQQQHKSSIRFTVMQIETDFPQTFEYTRTKQLELWKISTSGAIQE